MLNIRNMMDAVNTIGSIVANQNQKKQEKKKEEEEPAKHDKTADRPAASAKPAEKAAPKTAEKTSAKSGFTTSGAFAPSLDMERYWRFNYGLLDAVDRDLYEKMEAALLKAEPEIIVTCRKEPTVKYLMSVLIAVIEDNWALFYVENSLSVATRGNEAKIIFVYNKFLQDRDGYRRKMENVAKKVFEGRVKNCKTRFSAELAIHDYLVETVKYDNTDKIASHSPVGPLLTGKGVCEGIAEAFGFLCCVCGVKVAMVSGTLDGSGHRWNVIELGGSRYHVDVTADLSGIHAFFNNDDALMRRTHGFDRKTECTETKYNYYTVKKCRFKTVGDSLPFIEEMLAKGTNEFEIMVESNPDSKAVLEVVKKGMMEARKSGRINTVSSNNGCFRISIVQG